MWSCQGMFSVTLRWIITNSTAKIGVLRANSDPQVKIIIPWFRSNRGTDKGDHKESNASTLNPHRIGRISNEQYGPFL